MGWRAACLAAAVSVSLAIAGCTSASDASGTSRAASTPASSTTTTAPDADRPSGPSAGCDAARPAPTGTTDDTLTSGGVERSYQVTIPAGYDGTEPYPIVFGFHALTVDYHAVASLYGFDEVQRSRDVISVMPSGRISTAPYWNAAPVGDNDDLEFVSDLLDHLEATLCIDTAEVFSVGMSNGAQMSSMLACRLDGRIAAIAPIAGVEYDEPCVTPPTPVIAFHGTADPFVPYEGGGLNSWAIADQNLYGGKIPDGTPEPTGVDESMRRWAEHNGCDPHHHDRAVSRSVRKRTWDDCDAATVLFIVDGGGHQWPGRPQPAFDATFGPGTTEIDATDLMVALFLDGRS